MLTTYRRHLAGCPHKGKGQSYTLCACPAWVRGIVDGKKVRRSLQTADAGKAVRRAEQIAAGRDVTSVIEPVSPTLSYTCNAFLSACRDRALKESSIDSYRRTLKHVTDVYGNAPVASIDAVALDAYRKTRTIAPGTWRKELETLRALFAFCMDRDWVEKNPARKLRMPQTEELTTAPFTLDEVHKLLAACDVLSTDNPAEAAYVKRRARALVYALLYSGLRISDVAALKRSALDSVTGHLTLRVLKNGVRLKVLLHPSAASALAGLPAQDPRWFFWTGNGNIITCVGNLRRTVQRLGTIGGIHAHPHRFRDTFAVELLTNGADIRTVQKLLGHNSVRTTEKHYAHFVAAHQALLDSAAATLDFERPAAGPLLVHTLGHRGRNA